jgi:hypothetical protein
MGLLDDAIREHLELKRLRGADPGLVSREESDVFGATRDEGPGPDNGEMAAPEPTVHDGTSPTEQGPTQSEGFSNVGQETAEIDMRTVLESESGRDVAPAGPVAATPVAARPRSGGISQERSAIEDALECEMLRERTTEGSSEGDLASGEVQDEPIEDVLEETPDFLRDTPEQERLWFEQRPPRDFDFDK